MTYHKNENFFTIPNTINSYWAGFIGADGNVSKSKNTLNISLSAKDKDHLQEFASLVSTDYIIREYQVERETGIFDYVSFSLSSKQWKSNLKQNWSITPKKTHTLAFPGGLSTEDTKAYICGYIDGDGCIYVNRSRKAKIQLSICGTYDVLAGMRDFIEKEAEIKFTGEQIYATKNIYTFVAGGSTALAILDFLYDRHLPLLSRKWTRYLEFRKIHKPRSYQLWSEEENRILTEKHSTMSVSQMKKKFFPERTYTSIEKRCNYLGLKKRYEIKWTESEDLHLADLRRNTKMKIKEIHEKHFPYRTYSSVRNRARRYSQQ
jgi:hypothetical protein